MIEINKAYNIKLIERAKIEQHIDEILDKKKIELKKIY